MSTLLIDDTEQSNVAVFGVPGAYLHTDMPADKRVWLHIRYDFVDIMCEVNTDYKTYAQYEDGKKVLYVKFLREIYRCI